MIPIDARTAALWLFDERYSSTLPVDATGNLAALEPDASLTRPSVDDYSNGVARVFTASPATGLEVVDTNDDLALAGGLSIIAIASLNATAQAAAGTPGTLIWRGRNAELSPFGLRLTVEDLPTSLVRMQLAWEDPAGALVVDQGVLITWPDDEEMLVAAIREQDDAGFAVRYVVNDQHYDGGNGYDLDIGVTSGSSVFVGCEPTGASSYTNHLAGAIAYLEVASEAIAVEEVEQLWLSFAVDAPRATRAVRGLLPPGVYSKDPTSFIQREVDIEGAALADVRNRARRRRTFPDQASGDRLEEWEKLTGRRRLASDSIDTRQARIVGYLQTHPGLKTDDLLSELLDAMGYDDPADIGQLLYTVDHSQDFTGESTPGAAEALIIQGNAAFTVAASRLELDATAQNLFFDPAAQNSPAHLWAFTDSLDVFFGGHVVRNAAPTADDILIGFQIGSRSVDDWLFVGLVYDGVNYGVSWARYRDAAFDAGWATLESPFNGADVYFRFRHKGAGLYDVQWGTTDAAAKAQTPTELVGPSDPLWAGFAAAANVSTNVSVDYGFDDWYSHEANGEQPLTYHLFRDPADPGNYDIGVADSLLQAIGHAHFEGHATDVVKIQCDGTGGCDRDPLGV